MNSDSKNNQTGHTIINESSLYSFFYQELEELNNKSHLPLPPEMVAYSSTILEKFTLTTEFFSATEDGKFQKKILGLSLLESEQKNFIERKRIIREVGDFALMLSGFFAPSIKREVVDIDYYRKLGAMAYTKLNDLIPEYYDRPSFYLMMAKSFVNISILLSLMSQKMFQGNEALMQKFLIDQSDREQSLSQYEHLILGVTKNDSKKAS